MPRKIQSLLRNPNHTEILNKIRNVWCIRGLQSGLGLWSKSARSAWNRDFIVHGTRTEFHAKFAKSRREFRRDGSEDIRTSEPRRIKRLRETCTRETRETRAADRSVRPPFFSGARVDRSTWVFQDRYVARGDSDMPAAVLDIWRQCYALDGFMRG